MERPPWWTSFCGGRRQPFPAYGSHAVNASKGTAEEKAYYPMLEAVSQLCGGSAGDAIVQVLSTEAPTWLVQFPALVSNKQREILQQEMVGATRERMLREIGEALETITANQQLVQLVLEDLHWADGSVGRLISTLARRRSRGKLMLIGTLRPVDVTLAQHPSKTVKQDLLVHQLCREIALKPLTEAEVAEYLAMEAAGGAVPDGLAALIYLHSEGNPLFMVAALDHLRERGLIAVENGTWQIKAPLETIELQAPESLRQLIELQIEGLSEEEQRALEAASVTGVSFTAHADTLDAPGDREKFKNLCDELAPATHGAPDGIAAGLRRDHIPVLRVCTRLISGGLLSPAGAKAPGKAAADLPALRRWEHCRGMTEARAQKNDSIQLSFTRLGMPLVAIPAVRARQKKPDRVGTDETGPMELAPWKGEV